MHTEHLLKNRAGDTCDQPAGPSQPSGANDAGIVAKVRHGRAKCAKRNEALPHHRLGAFPMPIQTGAGMRQGTARCM